MKMDIVAGSKHDEYMTPRYAITPLLKYLNGYKTIWCPFDVDGSNFVKVFKENGFNVINTHIKNGQDFFETSINCDIIISNPPYSKKADILEKLFYIGKPFAMLLGVVGLFESKRRFDMFKNNKFEVMYFDKRISYLKDSYEVKPSLNPPFSSVYITSKLMSDRIVFEEIIK